MSDPSTSPQNENTDNVVTTATGSNDNGSSKLSFSLGTKKKRKPSSSNNSTKVTAAEFGTVPASATPSEDHNAPLPGQKQPPLVIPLSQPTQSLLTCIQQEGKNNDASDVAIKEEDRIKQESETMLLSAPISKEPAPPVIESNRQSRQQQQQPIMQQRFGSTAASGGGSGDNSREQLQRDLEQLPDQANEESYEQVPVSQFGAALLRGMGWKDDDDDNNNTNGKKPGEAMPRPHRLGLGAIPKADMPGDSAMPSVLSGRRGGKKAKKLSVAQLQQQEEFEKQRQLQKLQDKQRTLQSGSIVYLIGVDDHSKNNCKKRAKVVKLQGVPGLNMVSVQLEHDAEPSCIKRGQLGELVLRSDLEKTPFVVPTKPRNRDDGEDDRKDQDRKKDRRRSKSHSPSKDRKKDRDKHSDGSRNRDKDDGSRRDRDRRNDDRDRRRDRSRSRSRDRDNQKRDRQERGRDSDDRRRDERSRKKSRSERESKESGSPLWMIPNIRVRVVTDKLGKRHFRQKGVIVDVTRHDGAIIRMDAPDGNNRNAVVLEHVPERYLETALPKTGGQAIVLTGPNKWAKGRLLERNSKTSQGSIQVFEDMSIITMSLDDIAEWCGPLDDDLG